jgi:hypothetical protein
MASFNFNYLLKPLSPDVFTYKFGGGKDNSDNTKGHQKVIE